MAKSRSRNGILPEFSIESLNAFIDWLHVNRETLCSQQIASFLAVAREGRLEAGGMAQSTNSENIRELGRILKTNLTIPGPLGIKLTQDGQLLANLFCEFADFVAACRGQPYQWIIGGADTAIQWLVSPSIPKICRSIAEQPIDVSPGTEHRKPVNFVFRTGRTETLEQDLLYSRIHFCVLRRGIIKETLLRFDEQNDPKKAMSTGVDKKERKGRLRAEILGQFGFKVYVKRSVVESAKSKVARGGSRFWDILPFTMVSQHRVSLGGAKEKELEEFFEDAALNIELRCQTATQAANMLELGYAAVLASYFPRGEQHDVVEYDLKEFQIEIPMQTLVLVSPTSFCDHNSTARLTFDLFKKDLQTRLKR